MGIRLYYAINSKGEKQLVLVGVNSDGDDMSQGVIVDYLANCPPRCGKPNPLNSDI